MLAVPGTTGDGPKSKTGVSVAEPPWWITGVLVVRLTALAGGTTLTVTVEVASGPLVGETVSVYVSAPLALPVTVTLPPLAMVVEASVALQPGLQESVAGALPR